MSIITTGALSALWMHLQPPFAADVTLTGSIRFDRSQWELMEKELFQSRLDIVKPTTPIDLSKKYECPIELVELMAADRKDFIDDIVKYRVRRRFSTLNSGEKETVLLKGRLTYGQSMKSIFYNDGSIATKVSKLFALSKQMKPKIVSLLLGNSKYSVNKYNHKGSDSGCRSTTSTPIPISKDTQVSPWEDGLKGKSVSSTTVEKITNRPPSPFQPRRNSSGDNEMSRTQFVCCYVAIWRVVIGTLIHLDVLPADDKKKKYDTTVPRREISKRAGHWFGLHQDYRSRAVEQAAVEFSLFANSSQSITDVEFQEFLISMCEFNCCHRTKSDVIHILKSIENCWKEMFKASHTVSFRSFPSRVVYEPRVVLGALAMMTNDGYVITPKTATTKSGAKLTIGLQNSTSLSEDELIVKGSGTTEELPSVLQRSSGEKQAKKNKKIKYIFHRGGGRDEAEKKSFYSVSNDLYFQPECFKFTIGRRTPITPMQEDRSTTPGPTTYSPFSNYPFQEPFGSHGNTRGFPFEKSLGRIDSPRTRQREKELNEKKQKKKEEGANALNYIDRSSRLQLVLDRRSTRQSSSRFGDHNKSFGSLASRTPLYDGKSLKEQRDWKQDWKTRKFMMNRAITKPQTAEEYQNKLSSMRKLQDLQGWKIDVPVELMQSKQKSVCRRYRKMKESMATMCHPDKYQKNRRRIDLKSEFKKRDYSKIKKKTSSRDSSSDFQEDEEVEYEILYDENDNYDSDCLRQLADTQMDDNYMPTVVDEAMNILLLKFTGNKKSVKSKDCFWKRQRSSAAAMIRAFSTSDDMTVFSRATDPHTDRSPTELQSCRLDGEESWKNESEKITTTARVQGILEIVLIERAKRKKNQRNQLSRN
jgi:hypothetical protein